VAALGSIAMAATTAPAAAADIVDVPVNFAVQNVNRSLIPCMADGSKVTLAGRLVGPRSILTDPNTPATVSLYLHEFSLIFDVRRG
jgi:hypothetical protein